MKSLGPAQPTPPPPDASLVPDAPLGGRIRPTKHAVYIDIGYLGPNPSSGAAAAPAEPPAGNEAPEPTDERPEAEQLDADSEDAAAQAAQQAAEEAAKLAEAVAAAKAAGDSDAIKSAEEAVAAAANRHAEEKAAWEANVKAAKDESEVTENWRTTFAVTLLDGASELAAWPVKQAKEPPPPTRSAEEEKQSTAEEAAAPPVSPRPSPRDLQLSKRALRTRGTGQFYVRKRALDAKIAQDQHLMEINELVLVRECSAREHACPFLMSLSTHSHIQAYSLRTAHNMSSA